MSADQRKNTDKPLGDAGIGATGGGSFCNMPGPGTATGGDPKQGVRAPNGEEVEPKNRRLYQHPQQTAEMPYGSGDRLEPSGKGGMSSTAPDVPDTSKKP